MSHQHPADFEPQPEFEAYGLNILDAWENREITYESAREQLTALRKDAQQARHRANQARAEQFLAYMEHYRGNLNNSILHDERARALFSQLGNLRRIAICDLNIGEAYRYKGDFNRARTLFDRAYEALITLNDLHTSALAIGNRGQMLLSMGNLEAARADLLACGQLARQLEYDSPERTALLCELYHAMTELYLAQGQFDDAAAEAQKALKIAAQVGRPLERGYANRAMAEALSATPGPGSSGNGYISDSDTYYQAAAEAFQEIQAEGEIARTMFAHAKSLARRGRQMTAARKLQHAMVIFMRLGMVDDAAKAAETQLDVL